MRGWTWVSLFLANPSPDRRGCREAAGEGYSNKDSSKNFEEMYVVPLTRPAGACHPLPLGEGFARNTSQFGQLRSQTAPTGNETDISYPVTYTSANFDMPSRLSLRVVRHSRSSPYTFRRAESSAILPDSFPEPFLPKRMRPVPQRTHGSR